MSYIFRGFRFEKIHDIPEDWIIYDTENNQIAELKATSNKLFCDKGKFGGLTLYSAKIDYPNFLTIPERELHFTNISNILMRGGK